MKLDIYIEGARQTAIYPGRLGMFCQNAAQVTSPDGSMAPLTTKPDIRGLCYAVMGLAGECAELNQVLWFDDSVLHENIVSELGDILWYIVAVSDELGLLDFEIGYKPDRCGIALCDPYVLLSDDEYGYNYGTTPFSNLKMATQLLVHAGLLCDKTKKIIRDDACILSKEKLCVLGNLLTKVIFFYKKVVCQHATTVSVIGEYNHKKLMSRKHRGAISGSGDNR